MPVKKPVTIGEHDFESQKEAREYCQAILDKWYAKRTGINNGRFTNHEVLIEGEDLSFVKALLKRHPRYGPKRSEATCQGVEGICVAPTEYGSRCFYIKTKIPPMINFSYQKCITGRESEKTIAQEACSGIAC